MRTRMKPSLLKRAQCWLTLCGLGALTSACTGQLPGSFRLQQQEQTFAAQLQINTKIDLLWVVDNSSSMDVSQEKLRKGFAAFAKKYMQPTWDIRVAVITTDTYIAHPAFATFLGQTIAGTTTSPGNHSNYITSRLSTFQNPASNPTLVNLSNGNYTNGVRFVDLVPVWGPNYSRLLPGMHDGPIPALCSELLPYFLNGVTHCAIRDDQFAYSGPAHCLHPTGSENSLSQCVNTVENDTIHSGAPIISTMPPADYPKDAESMAKWKNLLIDHFTINASTGSSGHGSERGLGSVLQLLKDNEGTSTAFFRKGSLRGIIFISDEDDQTFSIEETLPSGFNPFTHYQCDQASLLALNPSSPNKITGSKGLCCSNPANQCKFGGEGISCPSKTVDGFAYTPSICPKAELLMPVASVKQSLDSFFIALDAESATVPNFFIASIVVLTGDAVNSLQKDRNADDILVGAVKTAAVDRGDRYIDLGNLVGNGSLALNIADEDYSPILDAIGKSIIEHKSTFNLDRAPTSSEDMIITIIHADESITVIGSDKFVIKDKAIVITDHDLVLSLSATDQISINYQPKSVF